MNSKGFVVLENVFTQEDINKFREEIEEFLVSEPTIKNAGGVTIPDFIKHKSFFNTLRNVKDNYIISGKLEEIFKGKNYRFCSHNDIGVNRVVNWHKDRLNGNYAIYQNKDIWSIYKGQKHEIYKVLIYLQDHTDNNEGLKLVPGSHINKSLETTGFIQLHPRVGDVVIFDQRITHRGAESFKNSKSIRVLVSFGFGKNNIFTDEFEKGTVIRQNTQNKCYFPTWINVDEDLDSKLCELFKVKESFTAKSDSDIKNLPPTVDFLITQNLSKKLIEKVRLGGIIKIPTSSMKELNNIKNIRRFAVLKDFIILQKISVGVKSDLHI